LSQQGVSDEDSALVRPGAATQLGRFCVSPRYKFLSVASPQEIPTLVNMASDVATWQGDDVLLHITKHSCLLVLLGNVGKVKKHNARWFYSDDSYRFVNTAEK
jgi:hypothetical protein